eukprot:COSAG06_NODE_46398_length_347_cov_0.830645_1_plen_24_part_01
MTATLRRYKHVNVGVTSVEPEVFV